MEHPAATNNGDDHGHPCCLRPVGNLEVPLPREDEATCVSSVTNFDAEFYADHIYPSMDNLVDADRPSMAPLVEEEKDEKEGQGEKNDKAATVKQCDSEERTGNSAFSDTGRAPVASLQDTEDFVLKVAIYKETGKQNYLSGANKSEDPSAKPAVETESEKKQDNAQNNGVKSTVEKSSDAGQIDANSTNIQFTEEILDGIAPLPQLTSVSAREESLPGAYGVGNPLYVPQTVADTSPPDNSTPATQQNEQWEESPTIATAAIVDDVETPQQVATPMEEKPSNTPPSNSPMYILAVVGLTVVVMGVIAVISACASGLCTTTSPEAPPLSDRERQAKAFKADISNAMGIGYFDATNTTNTMDASFLLGSRQKALDWILYEDSLQLDSGAPNLIQRYILALFYFTTTRESPWSDCNPPSLSSQSDVCYLGPNEQFGMRWLSANDECQWGGVRCEAGQVVRLEMIQNDLNGPILTELVKLTQLRHLALWLNRLSGTIPKEWPESMEHLHLGKNKLGGTVPNEIFQSLTNLDLLRLEDNQLTGTLPTEIGLYAGTYVLFLGRNDFSGSLPPELFNLSGLRHLQLEHNQLTGTIPTEIGKLANMTHLYIGGTGLWGPLPSEVGLMKNIIFLDIHDAYLSGSIPEQITRLTVLNQLFLGGNQLNGTISQNIGLLETLGVLDLSNNRLHGSIPEEISSLTFLDQLLVQGNDLIGSMPQALCSVFLINSYEAKLVADCTPSTDTGVAAVTCECCTQCCDAQTGICS